MTIIEAVEQIDILTEMFKVLDDPEMDTALDYVVKLAHKPVVPPAEAARLINQLQAFSALAQMKASYYTNFSKPKAGTIEYQKKNGYYTLYDVLDKLVSAVKFSLK